MAMAQPPGPVGTSLPATGDAGLLAALRAGDADVEPAEVCALLALGDDDERAILHRARARVRGELERYFGATA
jgi:hypothetical protein